LTFATLIPEEKMKRFIQTLQLAGPRLVLLVVAAAVIIGLAVTVQPVQSAYAAGSVTVDRADDPAVTASGVGAAACTAGFCHALCVQHIPITFLEDKCYFIIALWSFVSSSRLACWR
jgi:hypothetical protein